jgi:hypothetical protein
LEILAPPVDLSPLRRTAKRGISLTLTHTLDQI